MPINSNWERSVCISRHIPVAAGETTDPKATQSTEMPRGNGEKILVVDDEAQLLKIADLR